MTNPDLTPEEEPILGDDPPQARTLFGNKLYDRLKFVAQVVLPGLAVLWASVGGGWDIPHTDKVVVTIMAVDLFLGVVLGLSTKQYESSGAKYSGAVHLKTQIAPDGETPLTQVGIGFNPEVDGEALEGQKEITLRVIKE